MSCGMWMQARNRTLPLFGNSEYKSLLPQLYTIKGWNVVAQRLRHWVADQKDRNSGAVRAATVGSLGKTPNPTWPTSSPSTLNMGGKKTHDNQPINH